MREWLMFAGIAFFWGSSFFWIKVALEDIGPFALVAWRLTFAVAGLFVVMHARRERFPRSPVELARLAALSLIAPAVPFVLISWAETRIDSTVASVLNGTIPLFTLVLAHFVLHDERITRLRAAGLALGFAGVLVLFSRDLGAAEFGRSVGGLVACVIAEVLYACAAVHSRRYLRGVSPVVQTASIMLGGNLIGWAAVFWLEAGPVMPVRAATWVAVVWMGVLGSCIAFIAFFHLMNRWGTTRAAVVNYVVPAVGLVLGLALRGERGDWRLLLGCALIIAAVALAGRRPRVSPGLNPGG